AQAVEEKLVGRELRIGIYSAAGKSISEVHTVTFDSREEDARSRERKIKFTFGKTADAFNGKEIFLHMEERIPGTSHYRDYKKETYRFKRTFESDFEL
ncbi:MAG: hypothetical protein VCA36_04165, partial [Opitutales bacterium]